MTGLRPGGGQVPQPRRQTGRVVVAGAQHPDPVEDLLGSVSSRLSGRSQTPSRSSPNRLSDRVFRSAARVRASVPTVVITSVVRCRPRAGCAG